MRPASLDPKEYKTASTQTGKRDQNSLDLDSTAPLKLNFARKNIPLEEYFVMDIIH